MKQLLNIDLVSVNSINPEESVNALLYSSEKIKFGAIKLFAHYKPLNITENIEYIKIEKLTHESMNWFHLNTLPKYINNKFMLSIHDDGFIINPDKWDNNFLNYDYIAAPWPALDWCRKNRVGNGGFVLKSKKFLKDKPDYLLVLAWNFFEDIKKNNKDLAKNIISIKDLENVNFK